MKKEDKDGDIKIEGRDRKFQSKFKYKKKIFTFFSKKCNYLGSIWIWGLRIEGLGSARIGQVRLG